MHRSATSRQKSQRLMIGDGDPEVEVGVEKGWVSNESRSDSPLRQAQGDKGSLRSASPQADDEAIESSDEEEEIEPIENEMLEILPEMTVKELLHLPSQTTIGLWTMTVKKPVEQLSKEDWKKMKALTFTPTNNFKVPEEIHDQANSREEDGLFVGTSLTVSHRNLNRLKERIWRQSGTDNAWFRTNGNLQMMDPYRTQALQLTRKIDPEEIKTLLIFRPAQVEQQQLRLQHRQLDSRIGYELTIEVATIRYTHHPLFSKENVLAENLKRIFTDYVKRLEVNLSERSEQKLQAVRDAFRHTKEVLSSSEDPSLRIQLEKRLRRYRKEKADLRDERDESLRTDKMTFRSVLDIWKDIKQIRQEQEYASTSVQLKILSLEVDREREKEIWKEELKEEFEDLSDDFQSNFDRQMRIYRRKIRKWSTGRRVPAEKPYEAGENEGSTGSESFSSSLKPSPPSPFHDIEVRNEIRQRFNQLKRLPGEPKLILEMGTTPLTLTKDLPSFATAEVRRRKILEATRLQFQILFNMLPEYRSPKINLSMEFVAQFKMAVKIPVKELPECLYLQLHENGTTVEVINLGLPSSKISIERSIQVKHDFICLDKIVKSGHGGVGSNVKFSILSREYDEGIPMSGEVSLRMGWSEDNGGNILCPVKLDSIDVSGDQQGIHSRIKNSEALSGHIIEILDPNDPVNASRIHEILKMDSEESNHENNYNEDEFCDWATIQNSNRLRLLFLRDQEIPEFKQMRMIPVSETEILPDIFHEYEKRLLEEEKSGTGEQWKSGNKDDEQLLLDDEWDRLRPIREIRKRLLESFENSAKQITFEDLVSEEQIPDIGTLGLNLMSLFQPKRALRPVRKERKRIQTTLLIHSEVNLVINIVRAINLPLRKDSYAQTLNTEEITGVSLSRKGGGGGTWVHGVVKPFAEVWFQRRFSRTTTALGPDPTWNQELQLPLIIEKEDFSESILSRLEEEVYIQVYDEVAIDLLEDERRRDTDIHQRLEKRWLGCINIPFATLYRSGRIEGTFRLNCPPILLGYESKGSEGMGETYLTLFITIQPTITPPILLLDTVSGTGESSEMLEHVKSWTKELHKTGRSVNPFVLTPNGDTVLACRFLTSIEPPEDIYHEDGTVLEKMEALAHYVSLFPSLRDASMGISQYALWFTPEVFVNTPGGGKEDHSVLLASFFIYLGVNTWIIQGESIPDGPTTHLLTSFKNQSNDDSLKTPFLWNPCTGTHCKVNHSLSSLHKVWTAVGQYNIWCNISGKERPDELAWDIEKGKDWLPLFPKGIAESKLPRLQMGTLLFTEADEREGSKLAQRIERQLREAFMKWRQSRTTWNRYSSTKLRLLLPLLEERRADGSPSLVQDEHLGELREILRSYDMTGFPLHQPYSTLDSVMESVYSTGLHTIDTPNVQFALGAYAKAYPASIFSLWVYIAALHPVK